MIEPLVVTDRPERHVSIRLALEHMALTEARYSAGERGPDPHVHRLHADCFYVLDGAVTVTLADGDRVLDPGTFALVPPNVVHSYRTDGPGETRYLNIHTPNLGFDRYLQEIGGVSEGLRAEVTARFDQHPPPEDGGLDPATVIVRTARTEAVEVAGVHIGFLANADETLGAIGLVECTAPPLFTGLPSHVHDHTWNAYYVLEGLLVMRLGDEQLELGSGDVAAVPPGVAHGFANTLEAPTRFLDIHAPGGFEGSFREVAAAAGNGSPDPAMMTRIASRYDIRPAFERHDIFDPD